MTYAYPRDSAMLRLAIPSGVCGPLNAPGNGRVAAGALLAAVVVVLPAARGVAPLRESLPTTSSASIPCPCVGPLGNRGNTAAYGGVPAGAITTGNGPSARAGVNTPMFSFNFSPGPNDNSISRYRTVFPSPTT